MAEYVWMYDAGVSGRECPTCHCDTDNTSNRAVAHLACGVVLCSGACADAHAQRCRTGDVVNDYGVTPYVADAVAPEILEDGEPA